MNKERYEKYVEITERTENEGLYKKEYETERESGTFLAFLGLFLMVIALSVFCIDLRKDSSTKFCGKSVWFSIPCLWTGYCLRWGGNDFGGEHKVGEINGGRC